MRIALAHSHANTFGGGERAVLELARGLAPAHDVHLVLGGFDPARTYAGLGDFRLQRVGRLGWFARRLDAEAVVTNSFGANLLALRNGSRVLYWVHSVRSIFLQPERRRADLLARRVLDWVAVRRAARLVANSAFAAARLSRLYGRDPGHVVYPGVDLDLFQPRATHAAYAMTVGRLSPEKGLERLFDSWRELPDVPLHVVGRGTADYEQALRRLAPRGVVWRGALAPAEVAQAWQGASVGVFAPHAEEFGIAPLEAMASGVPVVAWREGGLTETVLDAETGYLVRDAVTFRQRVRLLVRDTTLRSRMGRAARARAEQFSWQRATDAIEGLCRELVRAPLA